MQSRREYSVHIACAAALFLLSGTLTVLPQKGANELSLLGFAVAAITVFILAALLLPLTVKLLSFKLKSSVMRVYRATLHIAVCIFTAIFAAMRFGIFVGYAQDIMLPHTPKIIVALIFFAAVILPSTGEKGIIMKFSLFSLFVTAAAVIFFFAASFGELELENIVLHRLPETVGIVKQALPYFLKLFPPIIIIYIYVRIFFGKEKHRAAVCGTAMGLILLGICILNVLLLFGAPLAAKLDYPYTAAVSTASFGELFTRMDGFSYFIYFSAETVQLAMCVSLICELLKRLGEKATKKITVFFLGIILASGCILS